MILLLTINIFTALMLSSCIEATTYYNQAKGPLPSFEDPTNIPHDEYIGKFLNTSEDGCLYVSLGKFGTFQSGTIFPFFFFPGPSCSKLTTSLVNDSLKFTTSDMQIF